MAKRRNHLVGMAMLTIYFIAPATASVLLFDEPAATVSPSTSTVTPSAPDYQPFTPPRASVAPILDVDPSLVEQLEMRPNETEVEFYERTKRFYEASVQELQRKTQEHFDVMESLRAPGL